MLSSGLTRAAGCFRHAPAGCALPKPVFQTSIRGFKRNRRVLPIILLEDSNLGMKGEVVEVRPGYGRNFLIPQKKAVYATRDNREKYLVESTKGSDGLSLSDGAQDMEIRRFINAYAFQLEKVKLDYRRAKGENGLKVQVTKADILRKLVWKNFIGLTEDSLVFPEEKETLDIGNYDVAVRLSSGWVTPGMGLFADFERFNAPDVNIKVDVSAQYVLNEEEAAQRAQKQKAKKQDRRAAKAAKGKAGKR